MDSDRLQRLLDDVAAGRVSVDAAVAAAALPHVWHPVARLVVARPERREGVGLVVVAAAGTSDLPVAEEAALVCEALGNRVERVADCGVAGLHRLLAHRDLLAEANAIIAVAGMEGALPSVIGGLVDRPVIAVPTSVGYGTSLNGLAALLAMLNSCAPGVSVVNIDCPSGASGDMILGALLDAGVPLEPLRAELGKLALPGWKLDAREVH